MIVKLLTVHVLEFISLTGGCRGSSESILVKISNCWKSHATAQFFSRCHVSVSVMCLNFTVMLFYRSVIVTFSGHTYFSR